MRIIPAQAMDANIREMMIKLWGLPIMVLDGKTYDLEKYPCLICEDDKGLMGFLHYDMRGEILEVLSLDCPRPREGAGGALLEAASRIAIEGGARRLMVVTTNDNTAALRFYQKQGFDICDIRLNAVTRSRAIKPEIPLLGNDDIPIRHEIVLERALSNADLGESDV